MKVTLLTGLLILSILLACDEEHEPAQQTTLVRVVDLRFNDDGSKHYLSAFTWDNHFYGVPALDTVSVLLPSRSIQNFGDFLMGRSLVMETSGFLEQAYDYRGPIDYAPNGINTNEFGFAGAPQGFVNEQPYRQGEGSDSRAISFPNLTHRLPVGEIRNEIDYYKWASFRAGMHHVGFIPILKSNEGINRFRYSFDSSFIFANRQFYFQSGGIYSLFLLRTSAVAGAAKESTIVRIQEDPDAVFKPTSAYVRFLNTIPVTGNSEYDIRTESVDVYMHQFNSKEVQELSKTGSGLDIRFLKSFAPEKLVASDLRRFQSSGKIPFIEIDYSEFLPTTDTTRARAAQASTYVFFAYPHRESQATRSEPLRDFTFFMSNTDLFGFYSIYPLARTASGFAPTISTVLLGTDAGTRGTYYNLEQRAVRKAFLNAVSAGN